MPVRRSLATLRSIESGAIARRERPSPLPDLTVPPHDLDINIQGNSVVAYLQDPTPQEVNILRFIHGPDLEVRQGELAEPEACTSRSSCTPFLRAGLRTDPAAGAGGACSTAFVVKQRAFTGILSASHCGEPDADVGAGRYHAGGLYGKVLTEQKFGNVDAEVHIDVSPAFEMTAPLIYANDSQQARAVATEAGYASMVNGLKVCKSGQVTSETCGFVQSTDYSPDSIDYSYQFIKVGYCSNPGDSGAAVYKSFHYPGQAQPVAAAFGIHSAGPSKTVNGEKVPRVCPDPLDYGVFGHIEFAEAALGVGVVRKKIPGL